MEETVPKKKIGRPRTRPLPDPNAPKRAPGRPKKNGYDKRITINYHIEAYQEDWLAKIKATSGKSYGEILDDLVERYSSNVE